MVNLTKKMIQNYISNGQYKFGSYACFVPIDDKYGVKLFADSKERDISFERQDLASQYNLAPKVSQPFDFKKPIKLNLYTHDDFFHDEYLYFYSGFVTEKVKTLKSSNDYSKKHYEKIVKKIDNLMKKLRKFELGFFDDHFGNFGYLNKKFVAIDFGSEGF